MIFAYVRVFDDETDWFPGQYEMPGIPPIGGHLSIMDRNSNMWSLRVSDVRMETRSLAFKEAWPNTSAGQELRVTIIGTEG